VLNFVKGVGAWVVVVSFFVGFNAFVLFVAFRAVRASRVAKLTGDPSIGNTFPACEHAEKCSAKENPWQKY